MIWFIFHLLLAKPVFLVAAPLLAVGAVVLLERHFETLAIAAGIAALVWLAAGALYSTGLADKQAEWDQAAAIERQHEHEAVGRADARETTLAAGYDVNEAARREAAADFLKETANEDQCATGRPLGAAGLGRLLTLAGER